MSIWIYCRPCCRRVVAVAVDVVIAIVIVVVVVVFVFVVLVDLVKLFPTSPIESGVDALENRPCTKFSESGGPNEQFQGL